MIKLKMIKPKMNKNVRNYWNNVIFLNFIKGDKTEKIKLLSAVIDVFGFSEMKQEQKKAAHTVKEFMDCLRVKDYFHLENVVRRWEYEWEGIKQNSKNWDSDHMFPDIMCIKDEDEKKAVLILGSMSANGYLRQKCLKELAQYKDSLPFLLLRLNDWVKEIRTDAFHCSMQRMEQAQVGELLLALPVMEKLKNSYRKDMKSYQIISENFHLHRLEKLRTMDFCEIDKFDQSVKNAFYRLVNHHNIYEKERLYELLEKVKGNFESRMVIHALVKFYDMSEQDFRFYLQSPNGIIRRYVIEQWTAKHGIWDGAEQYLMDRSKSVRSNVQYFIQNHTDLDIVNFYLEQLKTPKYKIAIDGLGETADKEIVPQLLPYLNDSDWVVKRKALRAIGNLLKEEGIEYYLKFLDSENNVLVKTAYQQCCKWDVILDIKTLKNLYQDCEEEQKKCYYLLLLRKRPFWECITFYLKLYGRVGEREQAILTDIVTVRPMFQRVSMEKGNEIKRELKMNREYLPEWLYKEVSFDIDHLMK